MTDTPDYKKGFKDGLTAVILISAIYFLGFGTGLVCKHFGGC